MANGSIVVGPQGVRRIDPELLETQARGMSARQEYQDMMRGPTMAQALRMSGAQLGGVEGRGAAATAPSGWNALATALEQRKGRAQLQSMQEQAKALRGEMQEGSRAGLQREADLAERDFEYQMAREDARTKREESARKERYQREDEGREIVEMIGPDFEKKTVQVDRTGKGYVDGKPINISEWTKANKGLGQKSLKPTGTQVSKYNEAMRLKGEIEKLNDMYGRMTPEERDELNSPKAETAMDYIPGQSLENLAKDTYYKYPAVKDYITQSNLITTDISKAQAGLNLTGFELKERQKWDFSAPGTNNQEKERRRKYGAEKFQGIIDGYERFYPDYTVKRAADERDKKIEGSQPKQEATKTKEGWDSMSTEQIEEMFKKKKAQENANRLRKSVEKKQSTHYYG